MRAFPSPGAQTASELSASDLGFDRMLQIGKDAQLFALTRDAALAFAKARDLALPTWWNLALARGGAPPGGSGNVRGRKPQVIERVKADMRAAISKGVPLRDLLEKDMQVRFAASRDTCRKAREAVLAESSRVGDK